MTRPPDEHQTLPCVPYFSSVGRDSESHLISSLQVAKRRIWLFGLTCNHYLNEPFLSVLKEKVRLVRVEIRFLNPSSPLWSIRYEMEPGHAMFHRADDFRRQVVRRYAELMKSHPPTADGGFDARGYDFWPVFGIEAIDDVLRVRLYGYKKRGTESPVLLPSSETPIYSYFQEQIGQICSRTDLVPATRL